MNSLQVCPLVLDMSLPRVKLSCSLLGPPGPSLPDRERGPARTPGEAEAHCLPYFLGFLSCQKYFLCFTQHFFNASYSVRSAFGAFCCGRRTLNVSVVSLCKTDVSRAPRDPEADTHCDARCVQRSHRVHERIQNAFSNLAETGHTLPGSQMYPLLSNVTATQVCKLIYSLNI